MNAVVIPCGGYITFTLTEEWTENLDFVDYGVYAMPGGTVVVPAFGTVNLAAGMLKVSVIDAPSDWSYVITKTFNVLDNGGGRNFVTETLVMDNTYTPFDPVVLEFLQSRIYLPIVVRNYN